MPRYIAAHTTGFEELKALVRDYTPERVAQTCGYERGRPVHRRQVVCAVDPQRRAPRSACIARA